MISRLLLPSAVRLATYSLVRRSRLIRDETYHVQRTVGVPVATSVEAVARYLSRGGFHGRHSAENGEGSLASQPLGVVSGHDQQRRGVVGTDACQRDQLRGDLRHQPIELRIQLGDLFREGFVTASHRTERELLGCRRYVTRVTSETEACSHGGEFLCRKATQTVAEFVRCRHQIG